MRPPTTRRSLLLVAAGLPLRGRAQAAPWMLGVLPNVSPRALVTLYQPMRSYLEGRLMQPVQVVTAPDFATFHQRACEGQYELFITAANLAAVALSDDKARALGLFEPGIPALAVARHDRVGPEAVAALRGHQLALANPASLLALRGLAWLREQGLEDGRDFTVVRVPNEDSLLRWLQSGDVALALMSRGELNQLSDAGRAALGVVQQFALLPGFAAMVPLRPTATPPAGTDAAALRSLLADFMASPASDPFRAASGMRSLRDVTAADRAQLAPFVEPTRRALVAQR
jgi:phosphonate transport system substrate-binding protein